jgi:hypothetical protein
VCATQDRKVVKVKYATDLRVKGTDFETFLKKVSGQGALHARTRALAPLALPASHPIPHTISPLCTVPTEGPAEEWPAGCHCACSGGALQVAQAARGDPGCGWRSIPLCTHQRSSSSRQQPAGWRRGQQRSAHPCHHCHSCSCCHHCCCRASCCCHCHCCHCSSWRGSPSCCSSPPPSHQASRPQAARG